MGELPLKRERANTFDLLNNPFSVLQIEPAATLDRIADAYDDGLADQTAPESDLRAAREAVINPRQRIEAELTYLIDTPAREVGVILNALRSATKQDDMVRVADRLAPISKANLLCHLAAQRPASADLLFALLDAHARIDTKAIYSKLTSIRKAAGIVVPSIDGVESGLHELLNSHSRAALSGSETPRDLSRAVEECTRRIVVSADAERIDALEVLIRSFERLVSPDLSRIEDDVKKAASNLQLRPNDKTLIAPISESLRSWIRLASPLVILDEYKERDHERARELFNEVRSLTIDLANDHQRFDIALEISVVASEVFKSLPRAIDQLKEDLSFLEDRSAELPVLPLNALIERIRSGGIGAITIDLASQGFNKFSKRETKELWDLFVESVEKTCNTQAADLPWKLLRSLAIEINNDANSPLAAKAILVGLAAYAEKTVPSREILSVISADTIAVERNILEKKLIEDLEANRTSPALEKINELLRTSTDQDQSASLRKIKGNLETRRVGRYITWGIFGFIAVVLVLANTSDKNSISTNPNSSPRPTQPYDNSPRQTFPTPNAPPPRPQIALEEIPPPGVGNIHSQSNIRYCRYQKERMKPIENDIRSNDEVNAFNRLVDDYNSRCGNFKYRGDDLKIVTAEVAAKAEALAAEGRNILLGWRRQNAPLQKDSVPQQTLPPGVVFNPDQARRPQGITPTESQSPQNIDLLDIAVATRTQTRLGELGYFKGPANGAWGPQSRSALRKFKNANGLADNDLFDMATASSLSLPSARSFPSTLNVPSTEQMGPESIYAPPLGASLNPLNRADATQIHSKLRALGFYRGNSNTLWSATSRDALREFKAANGMVATDEWDSLTEVRLLSSEIGFAAVATGTWSSDLRACPGGSGNTDAVAVTITSKFAEAGGARCDFGTPNGAGNNWKVAATCTAAGETWAANINLMRTGNVLSWSSERGTAKYYRCGS